MFSLKKVSILAYKYVTQSKVINKTETNRNRNQRSTVLTKFSHLLQ